MITVITGGTTIFCQLNELGEVLRQISGNSTSPKILLKDVINDTLSNMEEERKALGDYDGPLVPPGDGWADVVLGCKSSLKDRVREIAAEYNKEDEAEILIEKMKL